METDVVVIGGGATGSGVAWDLAQRGVRVVLAEMGDIATGTSGRYHGLLHSGARYATSDSQSAQECYQEHTTIQHIAAHALEDTGGLFVLAPGDDEIFVDTWVAGCKQAGIPIHGINPSRALQREPLLHPNVACVFEVPDAACDAYALCSALRQNAEACDATFLIYHQVTAFHTKDNRISGVRLHNLRTDETLDIHCAAAVIAAGPWSAHIGQLAGVQFNMSLSRGTMLAFNGRWTSTIMNRLRPPGDGDIFVPLGHTGVAGTTSVPTDKPDDTRIEPWERERIIAETATFLPGIRHGAILREWAGVRPLYDPATHADSAKGQHVDGRKAARTFDVLDHARRDGVEGLVTIVGGKLTTFRLMAEKTSDVVCQKLGVNKLCQTATTPLEKAFQSRVVGT